MIIHHLFVSLSLALALAVGTVPSVAHGADSLEWPSEQSERLATVQAQSHALQQKLFAARLQQDDEAVRRLTSEIKELHKQEVELLRASGQLPR